MISRICRPLHWKLWNNVVHAGRSCRTMRDFAIGAASPSTPRTSPGWTQRLSRHRCRARWFRLPMELKKPVAKISFGNSRAVLISLLVAAGAMVGFLPLALVAAPLFPFFLCAVGFVAVRFYRGRSSETLSTSAGARLGWMTGLWLFVVVVVMITMTSIFVSSPEGWEQLRATWVKVPQASQLLTLTQHEFLVQMLLTVPFSFFLLTLLPGLGGILGAKFWARRRSS